MCGQDDEVELLLKTKLEHKVFIQVFSSNLHLQCASLCQSSGFRNSIVLCCLHMILSLFFFK